MSEAFQIKAILYSCYYIHSLSLSSSFSTFATFTSAGSACLPSLSQWVMRGVCPGLAYRSPRPPANRGVSEAKGLRESLIQLTVLQMRKLRPPPTMMRSDFPRWHCGPRCQAWCSHAWVSLHDITPPHRLLQGLGRLLPKIRLTCNFCGMKKINSCEEKQCNMYPLLTLLPQPHILPSSMIQTQPHTHTHMHTPHLTSMVIFVRPVSVRNGWREPCWEERPLSFSMWNSVIPG